MTEHIVRGAYDEATGEHAFHPSHSSDGALPDLPIVRRRKYGQWVAIGLVTLYGLDIVSALATNEQVQYSAVLDYLFEEAILRGVLVTLTLTAVCSVFGSMIGLVVAIGKLSTSRLLRAVAGFYAWFFRGVPLLALILIAGNFAIFFDHLSFGVPFSEIAFIRVETNSVMTIFVASCIALSLHEGAYMGEVIRGGLAGVPNGQREAATALGMSERVLMRRIVLPQSMRMIVPPLSNRVIIVAKESSLVSVIAGADLMYAVSNASSSNFLVIEMLMVAIVWYLVIVSVLTVAQKRLERRYSRGYKK